MGTFGGIVKKAIFIWVAGRRSQLLGCLSANLDEILGGDGGRTWVSVI